ncbi:adiponectin receptor protein 2-like [Lissotriton helveticus]
MAAHEQEANIFHAREIQLSQNLGATGNGYPHSEVWEGQWSVLPYDRLPDWLKENDFLCNGHRPPLPSFRACFLSIFRLHTETGNIWSHLLGFLFFLFTGIAYMFMPNVHFVDPLNEKIALGLFFLGATLCLFFSWIFHTVSCRSQKVALIFSKLDYCGITMLIVGSVVPWIYYWFYCSPKAQFTHLTTMLLLGATSILVSQWEYFSRTPYRVLRAGVFVGLSFSGLIPFIHFLVISGGIMEAAKPTQLGGMIIVAMLYLIAVGLYAARIPERFFPGKFDIWFHSHQIFHVLVVAGAMIHLYYISRIQEFHSSTGGACGPDGQRLASKMLS